MGAFDCPSAWVGAGSEYKGALAKVIDNFDDVRCIVEIGVDYGYSLFTIARDFPKAKVFGIDSYTEYGTASVAKAHVLSNIAAFSNANLIQGDSAQVRKLWQLPENYLDIDILHIDGDHSYDGVKRDFDNWSNAVMPGGIVMFHDINAFPSVRKFFNELGGKKIEVDCGGPGLGIWVKDSEDETDTK